MSALREARRLGARAFGARGEALAAQALEAAGWRILTRKFVIRGGEIDLIARRDDTVAFVEVKARPRLAEAAAALTEPQRRRLARAAAAWLAQNPWAMDGYALRGDAVLVDAGRALHHIEDAFALEFEG